VPTSTEVLKVHTSFSLSSLVPPLLVFIHLLLPAYFRNSAEERAHYGSSVDERMTLLKFVSSSSSSPLGALSFFPVHCTSMSPKNHLISSDNKGLAALYMEKHFRLLPGEHVFYSFPLLLPPLLLLLLLLTNSCWSRVRRFRVRRFRK
jgi:hypothetical protein